MTVSETPLLRKETRLKEVTFAPAPPEKFVVEYPDRGVMHFDRTKPWTGTHEKYHPPTTASTEARLAPNIQPLADVPAAAEPIERHSNLAWFIGIGVLALGIIGVWAHWRKTARAAKT